MMQQFLVPNIQNLPEMMAFPVQTQGQRNLWVSMSEREVGQMP